jgi:hypothetical protein
MILFLTFCLLEFFLIGNLLWRCGRDDDERRFLPPVARSQVTNYGKAARVEFGAHAE